MGMLVEGQWESNPELATVQAGKFNRPESQFRQWVTADGSSAFQPQSERYHLYLSYACPWAHRTLIMRHLKGLQDCITVSMVDPVLTDQGWSFGQSGNQAIDALFHSKYLHELYTRADSGYTGRVTVPVLWDRAEETIVSNESSDIIIMLNNAFNAFAEHSINLYPAELKDEIDKINAFVYDAINNGVYKCGFAKTQSAYEQAYTALFDGLDAIENRLAKQRYLCGDTLTLADIRLYTTLVRFDAVYVCHFKCNKQRIIDYPNVQNYLRELYQIPSFGETTNLEQIKQHYYVSHTTLNPTQLIAKGPELSLSAPHHRDTQFSH